MYWTYLIIFILAVLIPDIIQGGIFGFSEERIEEFLIFFLGVLGFLIFLFKERQVARQKKEQAKNEKRLVQTAKDLVESYSYIGEINRKMDILMQIGLGLADQSDLNKNKEKEIYEAILNASNFILKADCSFIRIIDCKNGQTKKEVGSDNFCASMKNSELLEMGEDINIKKSGHYLLVSSYKKINDLKAYIIVKDYKKEEADNVNNHDILKFLAAQALSLFVYTLNFKINKMNNKKYEAGINTAIK